MLYATIFRFDFDTDPCGQPNGTAVEATGYQDVDQDMSGSFASNLEPVDTTLQVVIKSENEPDLIKQVAVVESEDGKFEVRDLEHFGVRPPVVVDERFNVGFWRSVINNVSPGFSRIANQAISCYHFRLSVKITKPRRTTGRFVQNWINTLGACLDSGFYLMDRH
jgi:hypothetical protein